MFPTDYPSIINRIETLDAVAYGRTRNFIDGSVSLLSPYISRGVVSLNFVRKKVLERHTPAEAYKFIFELAWREYFQRVWLKEGNSIFTDLKHPQADVLHRQMPQAVLKAATGIASIDSSIENLYGTGYMHNHLRMYVASIACNIGKAHWFVPSQWMYYHLLDGDPASNALSWQWVAGAFSNKKYLCNQENINKYTHSNQQNTFLDKSYEALSICKQPKVLNNIAESALPTQLPSAKIVEADASKPFLLYHPFSLNPLWRNYMDANRVLVLEPSFFERFPVSEKVMDFYLGVARNIEHIQVFAGELSALQKAFPQSKFFSVAHPAFAHWEGIKEEPEWMFPMVKNVSGSFMNFWKQCEKFLAD